MRQEIDGERPCNNKSTRHNERIICSNNNNKSIRGVIIHSRPTSSNAGAERNGTSFLLVCGEVWVVFMYPLCLCTVVLHISDFQSRVGYVLL